MQRKLQKMKVPLIIAHVPALIAYLTSEHVLQDAYVKRQNACLALEECIKMAKNEPHDVIKAVEKCKGSIKCPVSYCVKLLGVLHEALCKQTPLMTRPVNDPEDTCDEHAWNTENSFVRQLFGMQLEDAGTITHPMVLEVQSTANGNGLVKCLRDTLGTTNVRRAPLVLLCAVNSAILYPYTLNFSGVSYVLNAVATSEKLMYHEQGVWYVKTGDTCAQLDSVKDIVTKEACIIAYKRV